MSPKVRRLRALIIKESYQIIRDPSSLLISFVLPILLIFLYAYGVSLDLNHLRLGLVMEETGPDATELAQSFINSRYFDVRVVRDRRELLQDLQRGAIRGIVVIPSYFSRTLHRDHLAKVQVIADGSEPNTAAFVQNYAEGAIQNWQEQRAITNADRAFLPRISVQSRFWYNEQLASRNFLLPGSMAIIMTLIGILLTALVIAREWERGTMESMMSTPIGIVEIIVGKIVPYFLLGIFSMVICFALSVYFLGVPFRGSLLVLTIVTSAFLYCALCLGLMISTLAKNQLVAFQVSVIVGFLPAYILSGFLFEITSMPMPIQWITYLIPARYFVFSLQTLFLVGNVWKEIILNIIPMVVIGSLFLWIANKKTVKRLD